MRAMGINVTSKAMQKLLQEGCGSPMCAACGWNQKRVPGAWKASPPGVPYPCTSKLLGKAVTLRGDDRPSTVVGCATPLGESLLQTGKRSDRYRCQGAFLVKTPLGVVIPVPRSVVRERRREREGNCPDQPTYAAGTVQQMERAAKRAGDHPQRGQDIPFPHRRGSSACCTLSSVHPDDLERDLDDARDGVLDEDDYLARVRRAIPAALKPRVRVATLNDVPAAIRALRDHCWSMWQEKEAQSGRTRKDYKATVAALKKQRRAEGWKV